MVTRSKAVSSVRAALQKHVFIVFHDIRELAYDSVLDAASDTVYHGLSMSLYAQLRHEHIIEFGRSSFTHKPIFVATLRWRIRTQLGILELEPKILT